MPRLRRSDCSGPGLTRRRRGRGFEILDAEGRTVRDEETLERVRALAIPPAWKDVWICPDANGHLQAIGTDDAGRRQYRYHDAWRLRRDREKFEAMVRFARALPAMRTRVEEELETGSEATRERVLACTVRLLDRGFFRIGSEDYAEQNETYGLATMRKDHVTIRDGVIAFDYAAKGGQRRRQAVRDPVAEPLVALLLRRRGGGEELFAYKRGRRWVDIRSADINDYLKNVTGGDFTAKDFRTWNATVLAAVALAVSGAAAGGTKSARKRAMTRAIKETARFLGNTPAVCRASYIDPRVFDRFESGLTIGGVLGEIAEVEGLGEPGIQGEVEEAVLDLLDERESSPALEQVA